MSTRIPVLCRLAPVAFVLGSPFVHAQTAPAADALAKLVPEGTVVYLQSPSLDRLGEAAVKIGKLFGAEDSKPLQIDDLLGQMDVPGSAKEIDHQKPIAFCLVLPAEAGSEPIPMFFVPAKSPEDFVRSIAGTKTKFTTTIEGNYVSLSEGTGAKHGPTPSPIALGLPAGELVARIDVKRLVDHFRPMIEMGLGQIEMMMESAPPKSTAGIDVKPMMKLYMDGVRTFIDSGQSLDLAARLDGNRLEIGSDMTMVEGSLLAGFGSKEKADVRSLARFFDPEASSEMIVGMDQVALMKHLKPVLDAIVAIYPPALRAGFEKMLGSADEFAAQAGSALCVNGDFSGGGLRFSIYLHPRDPAKLQAVYAKMLSSMPGATLDEMKDGDLDGLRITRTRVHVDGSAFSAMQGKDADEKTAAKMRTMIEKMYGKDGLPLVFATKGDVTAVVLGGDEGFLRTAVGRLSKPGRPAPGVARALDTFGDLNPCFVLQYNLGKLMQGMKDLMGEELADMPASIPSVSTTFTYAGGIDGRIWRGTMSMDLAELGATVRAMKGAGSSQAQKSKAQVDLRAIQSALALFAARNSGKYPDGLAILMIKDVNGQAYLAGDQVPKDPWGREYRYDPPSGSRKNPRVYTYGKDGKPGGAGDDADIEAAGSSDEAK